MSRLHTTASTDSLISDESRSALDAAAKFDFSAMKCELAQSPTAGNMTPVNVPGAMMMESTDRVRFTTGHGGMEFVTTYGCSGGAVDVKDMDCNMGLVTGTPDIMTEDVNNWKSGKDEAMMKMVAASSDVRTEFSVAKNLDWKSEKDESMMKMMMKDEDQAADVKTSSLSSTHGVSESELKTETDKTSSTVDVVVNSNVTSSSSSSSAAAAVSTTAVSTAGSEITTVASASDLKKESQAINYDWVRSCSLLSTMIGCVLVLFFTRIIIHGGL